MAAPQFFHLYSNGIPPWWQMFPYYIHCTTSRFQSKIQHQICLSKQSWLSASHQTSTVGCTSRQSFNLPVRCISRRKSSQNFRRWRRLTPRQAKFLTVAAYSAWQKTSRRRPQLPRESHLRFHDIDVCSKHLKSTWTSMWSGVLSS